MIDQIESLIEEIQSFTTDSPEKAEEFRIKFLGKKGIINDYFSKFKTIPNEDKKAFGQAINNLKDAALRKVSLLKTDLKKEKYLKINLLILQCLVILFLLEADILSLL